MKKFLILFLMLFAGQMACKKEITPQPCACSPVAFPTLHLVIKDPGGRDLFAPSTPNYYEASAIKWYQEGADGSKKLLDFHVRPGFSYGNEYFSFYQLVSTEVIRNAAIGNRQFYLQIGALPLIAFQLELSETYKVTKIRTTGQEFAAEGGTIANYVPNLFVLQL